MLGAVFPLIIMGVFMILGIFGSILKASLSQQGTQSGQSFKGFQPQSKARDIWVDGMRRTELNPRVGRPSEGLSGSEDGKARNEGDNQSNIGRISLGDMAYSVEASPSDSKPKERVLLFNEDSVLNGVIFSEILQPPKSRRR